MPCAEASQHYNSFRWPLIRHHQLLGLHSALMFLGSIGRCIWVIMCSASAIVQQLVAGWPFLSLCTQQCRSLLLHVCASYETRYIGVNRWPVTGFSMMQCFAAALHKLQPLAAWCGHAGGVIGALVTSML
jgi:membrane associated rhomboid family serine protease